MLICEGLVGPRRGNVQIFISFNCISEVVKGGPRNPVKGTAERDGAVGGGRGRVISFG